ncbi:MAG: shikimate dehydrogenase [Abditibacteriota bacterium]|nr:shikimate dehydrogenase [Abditibacteriota bacterium]
MENFAFIIHPITAKKDIARKFPAANLLPESFLELVMRNMKPVDVSHITGIRSKDGTEAEGWFIGCPLSSKQFMEMPVEVCYKKIMECIDIAEKKGAKIVGLGAFTSVVGDAGKTLSERANIAVTSGNSYTIATAIEGSMRAGRIMGVDPENAKISIVGATGSIGKTCTKMYDGKCARITLVGRDLDRLEAAMSEIKHTPARISADVQNGIADADIVVAVSSSVDAIIMPSYLKPGAVVCDVARPRDVSVKVAEERDDVLVIEGGVVKVPGEVDFHFDFGFPKGTAYACMSETMILALEKRYESYTTGRDISVEKVNEISELATKHGFEMAGFRSFERAVSEEEVEQIRKNAFEDEIVE